MSLAWIDVADTAIKIGLGSIITGLSGYFVLNQTHKYEDRKETRNFIIKRKVKEKRST